MHIIHAHLGCERTAPFLDDISLGGMLLTAFSGVMLMIGFSRLGAMLAVAMCVSCASAGNQVLKTESADTVDKMIVDGKSTKADVHQALGDPNDTSFTENGNQIWKYQYMYATATAASFIPVVGIFAGGANVDKKTLTILFDRDGMVMKHTMSVSHEQVKRGS
jgi:outer membrane protein assembly factor BamE (lipoprotein component of BamABCDE complex)